MKPSHTHRRVVFTLLLLAVHTVVAFGNSNLDDILNPQSQVDYVIICPSRYAAIVQPLADFRRSHNGFNTAIVTTEAIYQIFRQRTAPDSAIREFITYSLTSWPNPKPQYFLLVGNVNAVPSHKEEGLTWYGEDSIMVDQWLVEGIQDTTFPRPAAAIGRFPGWNETDMATLVNKTIQYEQQDDASWMNRAIAVADYEPEIGNEFELGAQSHLRKFSQRWRDTLSVHVRLDSPHHRTRSEFRNLWNRGSAFVWFIGFVNAIRFSHSNYFVLSDIDSLAAPAPLPMVRLLGGQRFERRDTLCLASRLLLTPGKGSICTVSPTGLAYYTGQLALGQGVLDQLLRNPRLTTGKALLNYKRSSPDEQDRKETLLGDPALTIRHALTAGAGGPPDLPQSVQLFQNYPNPFNPSTIIRFDLPRDGNASLKVYDIVGREIAVLASEFKKAGAYRVAFSSDELPSGVYFYRLNAGGTRLSRKMVVVK
ncbi:MAG: T9SS type A sorting domain-containing protein [Ignavibacteriae bacterium]|nr:T9SS type A sorting domain-containing protein [Ignavibacteriota bacterium]